MLTVALNESMKTAVEIAQSLAKEYFNEYIHPAHFLRALLHKDVGLKDFIDSIGKDSGIYYWNGQKCGWRISQGCKSERKYQRR